MDEKMWKALFLCVVAIGICLFGFFLGRKTVATPEPKVITEYLPGETVHDSVFVDKPYKEVEPIDTLSIIQQCIKDGIYAELWPSKTVTEYIEVTKADTTAALKDWATKRLYEETLFDVDTLGKCQFNAEIQYNRMRVVGYEYTPVNKVVTVTNYKVKTFSPFVGAGAMFNPWDEVKDPMLNIEAGFFIKEKYGLQINYQHAFTSKNDLLGGTILFKF